LLPVTRIGSFPVVLLASLVASAALLAVPAPAHAADPTMADCLGASETSIKLRRDHHLREARQQLLVCAALNCPLEVRSECERRLVAVNSSIPTLVFEAKDAAGNDLSAVTVTMDGKPLADRLEGTALSLDPGSHSFHFETAGQTPIDKSFVLHEGEKDRRERIAFGAGTAPAIPAGGAVAPVTAVKGDEASTPAAGADKGSASSSWGPLKTVGVIVGGAGIVGIGIGAAFGLMAASDKNNANCDPNGYCSAGPLSDAHSHANVSTVGFVAGGVLVAAGLGLVIFAPRAGAGSVQVAPTVGAGSGGLVVGGAF
jgi:hypothetical protein